MERTKIVIFSPIFNKIIDKISKKIVKCSYKNKTERLKTSGFIFLIKRKNVLPEIFSSR